MTLHYLNVGLATAASIWLLWWMYSLAFRHRKPQPSSKRIASQPWDDDKAGGRGNR